MSKRIFDFLNKRIGHLRFFKVVITLLGVVFSFVSIMLLSIPTIVLLFIGHTKGFIFSFYHDGYREYLAVPWILFGFILHFFPDIVEYFDFKKHID